MPIRYAKPEVRDAARMWELARDSGTLDLNSPYFYIVFSDLFSDTSAVARSGDDVAGFICGFRPPKAPDTLFVWQITVGQSYRRQNIAQNMLRTLMSRLSDDGVCYLEATVTASNVPSQRMFRSFADAHGAPCEEMPLYGEELFPVGDHEDERLLRMGPFTPETLEPEGREPVKGETHLI